ncbi:MAG: GspE/PulE family protein [bacterium]|nr:GspE/PulE family protein [bacterium]
MTTILGQEEAQRISRLAEGSEDPQQTVRLTEMLLQFAVDRGASDVHIEPYEQDVVCRFRIDGLLYDACVFTRPTHEKVLARIKVLANLKIDEHRVPQDGRFVGKFGEKMVDFRTSVLPLMFGEKIVLRVLPREVKMLALTELGFDEHAATTILQNIRKPYGMILVCGPTGAGKSTTLYTLLQSLIAERGVGANINTIEDPVEYAIPRVNQIQAGSGTGLSFAVGLRGLLRQDADVIMVGEIRDRETAEAAIEASLTGRILLSSLHTRDAVGALIRLLEIGIEPYLIASAATLMIAQRLVRMPCAHCVESYTLDPDVYKGLETRYDLGRIIDDIEKRMPHLTPIPRPPMLFRAKGCDACMHTGFKGRTAVFEVLDVSDAMRALLQKRASAQALREQALQEGMVTMFQDGFAKALTGRTALEEILKATLE